MEKKLVYHVTDADIPLDVGRLLRDRLALTRAQIRSAKFRERGICLNGERVRVNQRVRLGDRLEVLLEGEMEGSRHLEEWSGREAETKALGEERSEPRGRSGVEAESKALGEEKSELMALDILYEDEDLLVVNKPSGLVVHPSHGHYADTLANMIAAHYRRLGQEIGVRAVGRLDKETSGAVLFAKNRVAAARLSRGAVEKEYIALVHGCPKERQGTIRYPIVRQSGELNRMRAVTETGEITKNLPVWTAQDGIQGNRAARAYSETGAAREEIDKEKLPPAVTHYRVLRKLEGCSLVGLWLETGRTHQIRVHMAALGHPLLGDRIYGREEPPYRAALHCKYMRICQPFTGEIMRVTAPVPEELRKLLGDEEQQ